MTDSQKLDIILSKVNKIDRIENEITSLRSEIKEVETSLRSEIKEVETSLRSEIEGVKEDVRSIKLTLENEIRPNIQRIAEGHLDLSRNLHEVMNYKDEIEMLSVNTRMLQSEIQELKKIS